MSKKSRELDAVFDEEVLSPLENAGLCQASSKVFPTETSFEEAFKDFPYFLKAMDRITPALRGFHFIENFSWNCLFLSEAVLLSPKQVIYMPSARDSDFLIKRMGYVAIPKEYVKVVTVGKHIHTQHVFQESIKTKRATLRVELADGNHAKYEFHLLNEKGPSERFQGKLESLAKYWPVEWTDRKTKSSAGQVAGPVSGQRFTGVMMEF